MPNLEIVQCINVCVTAHECVVCVQEMCTCVHACVCACMCLCIFVCVDMCVHTHVQYAVLCMRVCTCIYIYVCTRMRLCMWMCAGCLSGYIHTYLLISSTASNHTGTTKSTTLPLHLPRYCI